MREGCLSSFSLPSIEDNSRITHAQITHEAYTHTYTRDTVMQHATNVLRRTAPSSRGGHVHRGPHRGRQPEAQRGERTTYATVEASVSGLTVRLRRPPTFRYSALRQRSTWTVSTRRSTAASSLSRRRTATLKTRARSLGRRLLPC